MRKRDPRTGKRLRDAHTPTVRSHTKHQAYSHSIHTEYMVKTHAGPMLVASISVSPHEPCLLNLVGHIFLESSTPLIPTVFSHTFLCSFPSSKTEI